MLLRQDYKHMLPGDMSQHKSMLGWLSFDSLFDLHRVFHDKTAADLYQLLRKAVCSFDLTCFSRSPILFKIDYVSDITSGKTVYTLPVITNAKQIIV